MRACLQDDHANEDKADEDVAGESAVGEDVTADADVGTIGGTTNDSDEGEDDSAAPSPDEVEVRRGTGKARESRGAWARNRAHDTWSRLARRPVSRTRGGVSAHVR